MELPSWHLPTPQLAKPNPLRDPSSSRTNAGFSCLLKPNGSRWWRFDYRYAGKRRTLSMGVYPDVGLKDARDRRDEARKLLASDADPGQNRKAVKAAKMEQAANSFEVITREWYTKYSATWNASHGERIIRRFERDIFPWIGGKPIAELAAPELLAAVRRPGVDSFWWTLNILILRSPHAQNTSPLSG
jgi:hypothetical protein